MGILIIDFNKAATREDIIIVIIFLSIIILFVGWVMDWKIKQLNNRISKIEEILKTKGKEQ